MQADIEQLLTYCVRQPIGVEGARSARLEGERVFKRYLSQSELERYFGSVDYLCDLLIKQSDLFEELGARFEDNDDSLEQFISELLPMRTAKSAFTLIQQHADSMIGDTQVSGLPLKITTALLDEVLTCVPEEKEMGCKTDLWTLCFFWLLWEPDINVGGYLDLRESEDLLPVLEACDVYYVSDFSNARASTTKKRECRLYSWVGYLVKNQTPCDELLKLRWIEAQSIDPSGNFPGATSFYDYKMHQIEMGLYYLAIFKAWIMRKSGFF